ncbi:reverse transcriptase family protein [Amycolatopsis rhabdoformis]|uniref:RNA-directed DNA polymerase n=1 Tax=Amycolatopsis rhabdoformis TaxID=1448059 RepID=A0ABZ1HXH1_9PSEU|nr:reverse transcriptase family protein [Amycolatopsis rhabdoformis]WSE26836.1 reverse transcriptase family protein [Amycolatopsis rhabdoformis]
MTGERVTPASPPSQASRASQPSRTNQSSRANPDPLDPLDPLPPIWRWQVPHWTTTESTATALNLTPGELLWFSDPNHWNDRANPTLRHYHHHWIPTSTGGLRLIERPKPRLAELQRRIRRHVIRALPVHDAAHGFHPGRSILTCATPHTGQNLVVRMDLEHFFPSISARRIQSLLELAGYPPGVAQALAGILTTITPPDVLRKAPRPIRDRLRRPHLPQGAPSSPAVANAVTNHLDRRLKGLADALGANYTRYADDLAFSGQSLPLHRLLPGVRHIVTAEGFRLREEKTSIAGKHQRQRVAGLVVNEKPAAPRTQYDALRATLHNCVTTGPQAQNREDHPDFQAHLRGRIAWIAATSAPRGAKLKELFDRIDWS